MPEGYRKFAFVSGKGGVGKTFLAANFSFCSSTNCKTVLVDLDFQNQGASGLLAEYTKPGCVNAFDLLSTGVIDPHGLVEVRRNLFFIPAFDPRKTDRFGSQPASALFELSSVERFKRTMDDLAAAGEFDAVLIDCHGGLDDNSFSAFIYSDTTFIVTEADKVTFSGTLELLDFYVDRARAITVSRGIDRLDRPSEIEQRLVHIEKKPHRVPDQPRVRKIRLRFPQSDIGETIREQYSIHRRHECRILLFSG
jgi:MinD-like ATPase involved in chromosome partitioning or flagellar assembly